MALCSEARVVRDNTRTAGAVLPQGLVPTGRWQPESSVGTARAVCNERYTWTTTGWTGGQQRKRRLWACTTLADVPAPTRRAVALPIRLQVQCLQLSYTCQVTRRQVIAACTRS